MIGHIPRMISCICTLFSHDLVRLYALLVAAWVHILWSYREQQTRRRLIAILVTHDVIDWFELCTCPFTVTFKYSWMQYSRMAADPRKPQILNPTKIKAHAVFRCGKNIIVERHFIWVRTKFRGIMSVCCEGTVLQKPPGGHATPLEDIYIYIYIYIIYMWECLFICDGKHQNYGTDWC